MTIPFNMLSHGDPGDLAKLLDTETLNQFGRTEVSEVKVRAIIVNLLNRIAALEKKVAESSQKR